jgi:hypothetical protein
MPGGAGPTKGPASSATEPFGVEISKAALDAAILAYLAPTGVVVGRKEPR